MAGANVDSGHGCAVVFGTSSWTADILSISFGGTTRGAIPTSHMGTTATTSGGFGSQTYIPASLDDAGEITLNCHFDADTTVPVGLVAETITITWPKVAADSTAATWAFSGFVTGHSNEATWDDKMTCDLTIQISGKVTQVVAA